MTGGGSLARDLVSTPQPPIGVHMLRANILWELGIRVVSDPGPRTPEGTGGGEARRGVAPRGFKPYALRQKTGDIAFTCTKPVHLGESAPLH